MFAEVTTTDCGITGFPLPSKTDTNTADDPKLCVTVTLVELVKPVWYFDTPPTPATLIEPDCATGKVIATEFREDT